MKKERWSERFSGEWWRCINKEKKWKKCVIYLSQRSLTTEEREKEGVELWHAKCALRTGHAWWCGKTKANCGVRIAHLRRMIVRFKNWTYLTYLYFVLLCLGWFGLHAVGSQFLCVSCTTRYLTRLLFSTFMLLCFLPHVFFFLFPFFSVYIFIFKSINKITVGQN